MMAVLKCKMCGAPLNLTEGATVVECEYCGTKQTLSKTQDERIATMFERANQYRLDNEFDKAMSLYEKILLEDSTDAEAYWGLLLSKFGIEYVDDETQHRRVPTINRMQASSILSDSNYLHAVEYADAGQKIVYEHDAKEIANIQKGIAEISQKEEPFDVFICYKETDANGRRTRDSVLATELYHELTKEGFKVFFSRITLEDKIGSAYEPYIFAALNSASVMVVLGTKKEYFNAVWTRNEWSRFLALIKQGKKKTLIPAYKDMDPYDLPVEFANLQAQDMGKLGFMQDLIRGIKKITAGTEPQNSAQITDANINSLLIKASSLNDSQNNFENARHALERSDWQKVDKYYNLVLDNSPNSIEANFFSVFGKIMLSLESTNYSAREKNFEILCKAISSFHVYYNSANDSAKEALNLIMESIVIMYRAEYVYDHNVAENALGNDFWHVSLMNKVKSAFYDELKKIYEQSNETYIAELISKTESCVKIKNRLHLSFRSIFWIFVWGGLAYSFIVAAFEAETRTELFWCVVASVVFVLIDIGILGINLHPVVKVNEHLEYLMRKKLLTVNNVNNVNNVNMKLSILVDRF